MLRAVAIEQSRQPCPGGFVDGWRLVEGFKEAA
jgi:hypothetical protein